MDSKKSKEENNVKDEEKKPEKQDSKDISKEKFEEENIFLEFLKNSLLNEQ